MVKENDSIPSIPLFEKEPGNKVDLSKELASGKGLIIGVPAAFSPTCSDSHIPGYIAHPNFSSAGQVFVISVNDPFVMNAWGKSLTKDLPSSTTIRFLADPDRSFTRALDAEFEAKPFLGTNRSKRYAIQTEGGKVTKVEIEPDNTGVSVSGAEKVLG